MYSQPEITKLYNENIGGHPYTFTLGAVLHSSNEPGELSQLLCHNDSTINIVLDIIIIDYYLLLWVIYNSVNSFRS